METDPLTIYFCEHCGDYFARSDSCHRHCENRLAEPEKADTKRRATRRKHDEFTGRLEGNLITGEEDIGIKDM